ncbi:MAG: hypothetical protein COW42_14880 [Deltaproteobacteria bacterium CG17_big_fil_post_rev_8_21_14_2_50_63_7]|nr:MAG: hypothetical protein COW42_14880 [Deltaproteobacteria bacterium CG17_big_fil_post_rev_8_21_14_2_50_63_7]
MDVFWWSPARGAQLGVDQEAVVGLVQLEGVRGLLDSPCVTSVVLMKKSWVRVTATLCSSNLVVPWTSSSSSHDPIGKVPAGILV